MTLISKYQYDAAAHKGFDNSHIPSLTMSEFAEESDINFVVRSYQSGAPIPVPGSVSASPAEAMYGDFAELPVDLMSYYDKFHQLVSTFDTLPLEVKKLCNYDPRNLLSVLQNPAYKDFLVDQGVLNDSSKSGDVSSSESVADGDTE